MLARLPASSDAVRGEKHFVDHCAVCHRAAPDRPIVGAPLENITNWNREQWVVAILDPSRTIEPKYHQYALITKDGRTLSGLIEDRSTHHLTLVAPDGKRHEIELTDIERLKDQGVSLMPEGLESKFDAQAMADLLATCKHSARESNTMYTTRLSMMLTICGCLLPAACMGKRRTSHSCRPKAKARCV